jgi:hypothetical protein
VRLQVERAFRAATWLGVAVLAACGGQSVNERSGTSGTSGNGGSAGGAGGRGGLTGGSGGSGGSTGGVGGTSPGSGGSSAGGVSPGGMGGAGEVVCIYGDQVYRPGDSWKAVDDCNTCYCANDGTSGCTLIDCGGLGGTGGTGGSAGVGGTAGTGGTAGQGGAASCTEPPIGQICLRGRPGPEEETLSVGDEVRIELRPLGCYSSSCTEVVRADCALQAVEGGYVVTGGVCLASTGDGACTADCGGGGVATCTTELLGEGDHWLTFDDFQFQFSVPSSLPPGGRCESLVIVGLPER